MGGVALEHLRGGVSYERNIEYDAMVGREGRESLLRFCFVATERREGIQILVATQGRLVALSTCCTCCNRVLALGSGKRVRMRALDVL